MRLTPLKSQRQLRFANSILCRPSTQCTLPSSRLLVLFDNFRAARANSYCLPGPIEPGPIERIPAKNASINNPLITAFLSLCTQSFVPDSTHFVATSTSLITVRSFSFCIYVFSTLFPLVDKLYSNLNCLRRYSCSLGRNSGSELSVDLGCTEAPCPIHSSSPYLIHLLTDFST